MTKVDLVIVKWMNKFFPSVDQWVVIGSVPIQEGQSIWSRILRFFQLVQFLMVCVFFGVCVCMQFMHSRVNVFYWHMDAWILPHCYTWKSTGHIQTVEAFADVASGGVDATAGFYIQNVHWGCFPQDFSGTKASQLRYSMKHGMWWTLVDNLYCWWRCG